LRGQARHPGLHRVAAGRTDPRRLESAADDGAAAGAEHAAIRLVKSRLPKRAQPVPPIYQPEVAAEAIVWAADHDRRELAVGGSTAIVLLGNKILPGFGDWYLAKTGFRGQQTDEPEDPHRPHNLWEPIREDRGAHGTFDAQARDRSPQLWLNTHRSWVLGGAAGVAGLLATVLARRKA
jgi:hypothetical protein